MRAMLIRCGRPAAALLAIAAMLAMANPAYGAWTPETITESFFLSRPSMAILADNHVDIAYQRNGSGGGIFLATNATGSWVTERLTTGDHWAPTLDLGPADIVHVAYVSFGTDAGIHHLTNATGSWVDTRLTTDADAGEPTMVVDGAGKVHIAYPDQGLVPGVFYLTDQTGSWVKTRLTTSTNDWSPDLVLDGSGNLHLAFARFSPENPGLYYLKRTAGTWSAATRITTNYDDLPALAVDGAGKVHMAFQRFASLPAVTYYGQLFYATNASGSWQTERLPGCLGDFTIGPPAITFNNAGLLHIAAYEADRGTSGATCLQLLSGSLGAWSVDGNNIESNFPSIAFDGAGTLHLSYRSYLGDWAGIEHRSMSVHGPVELVDRTVTDDAPSLAVEPDGTRHLAYNRTYGAYSERGVHYGDDAASWVFERVQYGYASDVLSGPPELGLAPDGSARIITRATVNHVSNATGEWVASNWGCGGGSLAVDADGHSHVACNDYNWIALNYHTDASGTWSGTEIGYPVYSGEKYAQPAIAVDATGRRSIVFVMQSESTTPALMFVSAAAGAAWPTSPTRLWSGDFGHPDAAVDAAGKLHVAFQDYGSSPGIYYATNASGTWVKIRLSRSGADFLPSIALDQAGKVYVAFDRGSQAANPGLYVVSNRSGSWATYQVTAVDTGDPSLVVGPDGKLDLAYADGTAGIRILSETTGLAARISMTPTLRNAVARALAAADIPSNANPSEPVPGSARTPTGPMRTTHPPVTERAASIAGH
jgi:hypothetical protein